MGSGAGERLRWLAVVVVAVLLYDRHITENGDQIAAVAEVAGQQAREPALDPFGIPRIMLMSCLARAGFLIQQRVLGCFEVTLAARRAGPVGQRSESGGEERAIDGHAAILQRFLKRWRKTIQLIERTPLMTNMTWKRVVAQPRLRTAPTADRG